MGKGYSGCLQEKLKSPSRNTFACMVLKFVTYVKMEFLLLQAKTKIGAGEIPLFGRFLAKISNKVRSCFTVNRLTF